MRAGGSVDGQLAFNQKVAGSIPARPSSPKQKHPLPVGVAQFVEHPAVTWEVDGARPSPDASKHTIPSPKYRIGRLHQCVFTVTSRTIFMNIPNGLLEATLESYPTQIALLDSDGIIVYTNERWTEFAQQNGLFENSASVGENYITVSENDKNEGKEAVNGLSEVLAGEQNEYMLEYPCHTETEQNWFIMHAKRFTHSTERYVLVAHIDITERKLAETDVQEKNTQLETLTEILSHDLRNPLSIAKGHLDLLQSGSENPGESMETIAKALDRMDEMISNALVLGQSAESISKEQLSLQSIAQQAWENTNTFGTDVTLHIQDEPMVYADNGLILNLLENLFRNSLIHGESVTQITVGSLSENGFYVEDNGQGIPEKKRETSFDKGVTTGGSENSGLGLSIVHEITAMHDWTVAIEEAHSGGARFVFQFEGVTKSLDCNSRTESPL